MPVPRILRRQRRVRLWNGSTAADACFRAVEALAAAGHSDVPIVPCPRAAQGVGFLDHLRLPLKVLAVCL